MKTNKELGIIMKPVSSNQEIELGCAHGCTNSQVAKQCPIHAVERITKLIADSGPRIDTSRVPHGLSNLPPEQITAHKGVYVPDIDRDPSSPATPQPVVISTVFKAPAEKDSSRCSLDGAPRIPLNREGTKFGACTLVNGKDGTGGCKDPLHDYEIEQQAPAVEPQKQYNIIRGQQKVSLEVDQPHDTKTHAIPEAGSTRPEMPPVWEIGNQLRNELLQDLAIAVHKLETGKLTGQFLADISTKILGISRAASVKQEPLSAALRRLVDEVPRNGQCDEAWEQAEAALKSQPAAPRTQLSPKCPKCGHCILDVRADVTSCGYHTTDFDFCGYRGKTSEFFTALPEAPSPIREWRKG